MKDAGSLKSNGQLIWGIALLLVGIAVFIRIPQVMLKLAEMGQFGGGSRFGLYLMGVILVGGGVKKIVAYAKAFTSKTGEISENNDKG